MEQLNLFDWTHVHRPTGTKCRIKKNYGAISTCFVEPYQWTTTWGKAEYLDIKIFKNEDLLVI